MPHIEQIPLDLALYIRHKAMYSDKDPGFVKLEDDEEGVHFGLFEDNKLISVGSWFRRNEFEAQFRKLATVEQYRNSGFGTLLLNYIIDFSKTENIKRTGKANFKMPLPHILRILSTFRVKEWRLALDANESLSYIMAYPLNFVPVLSNHLRINFEGITYFRIRISNRAWRMIYAWIKLNR